MVLVVCCCGLRTELRTPWNLKKNCTNSRTISKADVYNKYVCSKFEFYKIFLENSPKTRRSWCILHPIRALQMNSLQFQTENLLPKEPSSRFFFFLTDFFVCSQSGYHPWEVAIINGRFSQVWLYTKHEIKFILIIFLYFGQVRKFGDFFLFFFIPLQSSGDWKTFKITFFPFLILYLAFCQTFANYC